MTDVSDNGDGEVRVIKRRKPGGGRKRKEGTLFKEASDIFLKAAPQLAIATVNRAIGDPVDLKCPKCKHEFQYLIPGAKGDSKLLEYSNDRNFGKPVVKQDISLNAKIEMPNQQLVKYHILVSQTQDLFKQIDTTELDDIVKQLPEKPENFVEGELVGTS